MNIRKSLLQDLQELITPKKIILQAIANQVRLDCLEDARSIYRDATKEKKVAQFIVGVSLQKLGRREAAEAWLSLSAEQGFGPAELHFERPASA